LIPTGFKPNLAATLTKPELIKFPVWASPKIDGIRCVVFGGVAYSRSLKPIPNAFVQEWAHMNRHALETLDGELVVGSPTDPNAMQNSMAVMRKTGTPHFRFYVFDAYMPRAPFVERKGFVSNCLRAYKPPRAFVVTQAHVQTAARLDEREAEYLEHGFEGMMIRDPGRLYKCGRSTEREGGLVKVKRFVDAEAIVYGFVEEMHNTNEAKTDALGSTERSTAKAGLVGKGTLGALMCMDEHARAFNIGTGFSAAQRAEIWRDRDRYEGQLVKFKYFDHGIKEAPRHPVFISFRHEDDTSK
jgi:DNA ligase-1